MTTRRESSPVWTDKLSVLCRGLLEVACCVSLQWWIRGGLVNLNASVEDLGDVSILALSGFLDFETIDAVRRTCLERLKDKKVVIDLTGLNFVGSSGISILLETIRQMAAVPQQRPKMAGLSSEFKRVFIAAELGDLELYPTGHMAAQSFAIATGTPELSQPQVSMDWLSAQDEISEPVDF